MWTVIKKLAASRKVFLAVLSAVIWGAGRFGLELSQDDLLPIVGPLWLAVFGVAAEDFGKGAALAKLPPSA